MFACKAKHFFPEVLGRRAMCHCVTSQSDSWTLVTCLTGAGAEIAGGAEDAAGAEAGGGRTTTSSDDEGEARGDRSTTGVVL